MGGIFGGGTQKQESEPWKAAQPSLRRTLRAGNQLFNQGKLAPAVVSFSPTTQAARAGIAGLADYNSQTEGARANYDRLSRMQTSTPAVNFGAGVWAPTFGGGISSPAFAGGISGPSFGSGIDTMGIRQSISDQVLPEVAGMFGRGGFANSTTAQQAAAGALGNALAGYEYDAARYNVARDDQNAMFNTGVDQYNLNRKDQNTMFGTDVDQYNRDRADQNAMFRAGIDQYNVGRRDNNNMFNAQLREAGLDRGINRELSAIDAAGAVSDMRYNDLNALMAVGQQRDLRKQQLADQERQNLLGAAQLFSGIGGMGGTQAGQNNPGFVDTVAGLGQAALPWAILCDRRLKKDIEPAGEYKGVPIYTFRYTFDDTLRIGPMADEVPERARFNVGGINYVDMGAI